MGSTAALLPLAALLVLAKVAGSLSARAKLPTVVGKLLLGVLLGPSLLGWIGAKEPLTSVASVGVILLMFMAGVETDLTEMRRVGAAAMLVACGGVVLPLAGGAWLAHLWGYGWAASIFLGVVLTATSVSVTAQTLRELGKLRTRAGTVVLGAAVIDDVLGIVLLSVVFGLESGGNPVLPLGKMVLFFFVAFLLGMWVLPRLFAHLSRLQSREVSLAIVLGMIIAAAWAAEELGNVAAITGAYLFGLAVAQHPEEERHRITYGIDLIGNGFFVPIFFVVVGLEAQLGALIEMPVFCLLLVVVAVVTKAAGAWIGATLGKLTPAESVLVSVGMVTRGEVALVVATLGKTSGILDDQLFAATLAMVLLTTVATPVLLRLTALRRTTEIAVPPTTPAFAPADLAAGD